MSPAPRSLRQQQRELSAQLREKQHTWVQIGNEFCERYGVNIRAALRMAHDWSQRDAAEQWNRRWPADPKTFKNFSYWELWPGPTGHAPSLDVLARLAELYECSVADLVSDCPDFRDGDIVYRDARQLANLSGIVRPLRDKASEPNDELVRASPAIHDPLSRLELIDVHELARLTASWSEQLGTSTSRRALLLKLSAGLSLAAASPSLVDDGDAPTWPTSANLGKYSGIWYSRYVYSSTGRSDEFVGEHYVVVRQSANRLVGQSVPHTSGSQLRIELALDASVATGTWREVTSPTGYYKGASYHGTLQMVVDPSGRQMRGMWLGFGRDFTVNSGEWKLTWRESLTARSIQRNYHLRV